MYIFKNIEQQVKQIDCEFQSPSIKSSQTKNDLNLYFICLLNLLSYNNNLSNSALSNVRTAQFQSPEVISE